MAITHVTQDTFSQEVLNSSQTVLIDFWATWCGPCRMVAPILEELDAQLPEVRIVKIDVDEQPELARQFRIASIPTLVVMRQGQEVRRSVGAMPKESIMALLQ